MKRSMTLLLLGILASSSMAQTTSSQTAKNVAQSNSAQAVQTATAPTATTTASAIICGCEGAPPPEVLAIVNGAKITAKEVDDAIRLPLAEIQRQVIAARRL